MSRVRRYSKMLSNYAHHPIAAMTLSNWRRGPCSELPRIMRQEKFEIYDGEMAHKTRLFFFSSISTSSPCWCSAITSIS